MRRTRIYTRDEKIQLLSEFSESGLSMTEFQRIKGMGHCTLSNWFATFAEDEPKLYVEPMKSTKIQSAPIKSLREIELEQENKRLRDQLEYEKLRAHAYDTMINIAERELKIEIRKKSGAKQ